MKHCYYFILAVFTLFFAACSKESSSVEEPQQNVPEEVIPTQESRTITFGVAIDFGDDATSGTETKASLSGMDINWIGGETIFIANDKNSDIEDCILTKDPSFPTKGTISVTAVEGASTYYALYTGGTSHADGKVTFNPSTATFGGSDVTLSHTAFYTDTPSGMPVSMVGKTTGENLVMKPCLALIKFKISSKSVESQYADGYSGVRGLMVKIRKSGSRKTLWGNFTVNISGSDASVASGATPVDYFELNNGLVLLDKDVVYYIPVLPLGSCDRIELTFYGFNSATPGDHNFNAYSMSLDNDFSIDPGDIFNFGTLDPVSLKKAADAFVPAVNIDGEFTDWDGITEYEGGASNTRINKWRMTSDSKNVYIYAEIVSSKITNSRYFYVGFDTKDGGSLHGGIPNLEQYVVIYPAVAGSDPVEFIHGVDPRSTVNGSGDGSLTSWGVAAGTVTYFEICIPRSKISLTTAGTVKVAISYDEYATSFQDLTL